MTDPVLVLNFLPQTFSLQRYDMVLCLQPVCTFSDPHSGQQIPVGQRSAMNHASAVASSGNIVRNCLRVNPLRCALPGAFCAMTLSYPTVAELSMWNSMFFQFWLDESRVACVALTCYTSCAVERRFLLAGANPAQQLSLRLVAARAVRGGNEMD